MEMKSEDMMMMEMDMEYHGSVMSMMSANGDGDDDVGRRETARRRKREVRGT